MQYLSASIGNSSLARSAGRSGWTSDRSSRPHRCRRHVSEGPRKRRPHQDDPRHAHTPGSRERYRTSSRPSRSIRRCSGACSLSSTARRATTSVARDQTGKSIGQLTQIRHQQAGIKEFTSGERPAMIACARCTGHTSRSGFHTLGRPSTARPELQFFADARASQ